MNIPKKVLKKIFKKHYKKVQLIERVVQYGRDIEWFFTNYERVLIAAGLEYDVRKLKNQSSKILEDAKNLFKIY